VLLHPEEGRTLTGNLLLLLWLALVIVGIGAMQWGASRASDALDAYAGRAGMRGTVAGALLGMATATPEISVNIASVAFGWPDLGLGAALGSNVPALPLIFLLSWLSLRSAHKLGKAAQAPALKPTSVGTAAVEPPLPVVAPAAVEVQAVPYLLIVLLLAALTLPPRWAGLQPSDGLFLLAAWGVYLARALLRPRKTPASSHSANKAPIARALLGVPAIALGALASVVAARRLGEAFGASDMVVGLFVIGLLCALPESFAAWRLAREGKTTTAVSTAMADGIVSLSVALIPPALVGAAVGDPALYLVNLIFLVFVLLAYIALNHFRRGQELGVGRVSLFVGAYAVYLAAVVYLLSR
jgi:cation:H+ antiporter